MSRVSTQEGYMDQTLTMYARDRGILLPPVSLYPQYINRDDHVLEINSRMAPQRQITTQNLIMLGSNSRSHSNRIGISSAPSSRYPLSPSAIRNFD